MFGLEPTLAYLLVLCIIAICAFEFINGFHDTANAVATVIYTNSLPPRVAVVWSGLMNFIGVYVGGIAVAMGIVNLLPMSILIDQNVYHSLAMILAIVITAILWNLGTWYIGIPCSSSHTLIGSIFGVAIAYGLIPGNEGVALNWGKVKDVGLSLMISPLFGFSLAILLMLFLKKVVKDKKIFDEPNDRKAPPFWIRLILILTCTSVSFSHGSNDGQKGVGLMMIVLIGLIPTYFALDHTRHPDDLMNNINRVELAVKNINRSNLSIQDEAVLMTIDIRIDSLSSYLSGVTKFYEMDKKLHFQVRKEIIMVSKDIDKLLKHNPDESNIILTKESKATLISSISELKKYTEYAPWWVILMISISLGLGTMIGWKRIVVTVGEKIGKTPLTYAQGASAELVASTTILVSTYMGLPVSTTHVLSSGVAGAMVAKKGKGNLRRKTVRNILIAWIVTLPVTIIVAGGLFLLLRMLF